MKIFIGIMVIFFACSNQTKYTPVAQVHVIDTIPQNVYVCDSLHRTIDSLKNRLFISEYKVQRVKYYLNITLRNPSQTKFLKGWIKRAVQ